MEGATTEQTEATGTPEGSAEATAPQAPVPNPDLELVPIESDEEFDRRRAEQAQVPAREEKHDPDVIPMESDKDFDARHGRNAEDKEPGQKDQVAQEQDGRANVAQQVAQEPVQPEADGQADDQAALPEGYDTRLEHLYKADPEGAKEVHQILETYKGLTAHGAKQEDLDYFARNHQQVVEHLEQGAKFREGVEGSLTTAKAYMEAGDVGNGLAALKGLGLDIDMEAVAQYVGQRIAAEEEGRLDEFNARFAGSKARVDQAMELAQLRRERDGLMAARREQEMEYWSGRFGQDEDIQAVNKLYGDPNFAVNQIVRVYKSLPEGQKDMAEAYRVAKEEFRHAVARFGGGKAPAAEGSKGRQAPAPLNPPSAVATRGRSVVKEGGAAQPSSLAEMLGDNAKYWDDVRSSGIGL